MNDNPFNFTLALNRECGILPAQPYCHLFLDLMLFLCLYNVVNYIVMIHLGPEWLVYF